MSLVKIEDASGKTVTYIKMEDGRLLPTFDVDVMKNVPSLKLREDDIMICAYPKSGTHWVFEICRMLLLGTTDLAVIAKDDFMIEDRPQNILNEEMSIRILNSHYRYNDLPTELHAKKPKIIYVKRNPKDVAVSFYNHTKKLEQYYNYNGEFNDYLKLFVDGKVDYGSWFDYVKEWEMICQNTDLHLLDLSYEEIKHNTLNEIRRISDFLGVDIDEDLLLRINKHCSFSSMLKRKGHLCGEVKGKSIMYRKGDVGDWNNWFTVTQNEWFDQKYREKMKESQLEFIYQL